MILTQANCITHYSLKVPVGAGPFTVSYPGASIAVGLLVAVQGIVIVCRTTLAPNSAKASAALFDTWSFFVFLAAASIQVWLSYFAYAG
jgi:hypothetical protein